MEKENLLKDHLRYLRNLHINSKTLEERRILNDLLAIIQSVNNGTIK